MRIMVQVINAIGVKQGGSALNAVDLITFFEKEFSQISTILAGDSGN